MQPLTNQNYRPPLNWKRPTVLLIDGDAKRQFGRAARMRGCGVVVDCADDGATAYALWRPHAYQLVLIDFRGANEAVRDFCVHVQASLPPQKIGFYRPVAPFLATAEMDPAPAAVEALPATSDSRPAEPAKPVSPTLVTGGRFMEAAQRIAALQSRTRNYGTPARHSPAPAPVLEDRSNLESAASLAARILGGG